MYAYEMNFIMKVMKEKNIYSVAWHDLLVMCLSIFATKCSVVAKIEQSVE
jgi:hypothetical protein